METSEVDVKMSPPNYEASVSYQPSQDVQVKPPSMWQEDFSDWMPAPPSSPGAPHGFEYLTQIDQLMVYQSTQGGRQDQGVQNTSFSIKNNLGQLMYIAKEEKDQALRTATGASFNGSVINIKGVTNQVVFRLLEEIKCSCSFCCAATLACCAQASFACWGLCICFTCCSGNFLACTICSDLEVLVEAPAGQVLGFIQLKGGHWKPSFAILDSARECVFKVEGPSCCSKFPITAQSQTFTVYSEEKVVGEIEKLPDSCCSGNPFKQFQLSFPMNLEVKEKALLMVFTLLMTRHYNSPKPY